MIGKTRYFLWQQSPELNQPHVGSKKYHEIILVIKLRSERECHAGIREMWA